MKFDSCCIHLLLIKDSNGKLMILSKASVFLPHQLCITKSTMSSSLISIGSFYFALLLEIFF